MREIISKTFTEGKKYVEIAGNSSETKPVDGIITGSKFKEVDTGKTFLFDESSNEWFYQGTEPEE